MVGGARGAADRYPRQYLGCRRTGDGGRRNLLVGDRAGFCVGQAIIELFGFGPPVEGHDDDAGELTRPMEVAITSRFCSPTARWSPFRKPSAASPSITRQTSPYHSA